MKAIGSWSAVSFIRFIVQFAWAVVLVTLVIQSLWLLFIQDFIPMPFPVYLESRELVSGFREFIHSHQVAIFSLGSVRAEYQIFEQGIHPALFITLIQIGLTALALYALTVLKRPLNALVLEKVFEPENGADLRKAAIIFLLASSLKFGYEYTSMLHFWQLIETENKSAVMPPFDFTLLAAGLICYVIAEIVNQAAILYEEQKLTV